MACPYTNKALQTMCKYEGLKCSGTKEELCQRLLKHFQKLGENINIDPKRFSPKKYYAGLSLSKAQKRKSEIEARMTREKQTRKQDFSPFKTDRGVKTKPSIYTKAFHDRFPRVETLQGISTATGIPLDILQKVYDKGLAAWRTGHRPGATGQQWAFARVYSFVMKGCTYYSPDDYLVMEAKDRSQKAKKFWKSVDCICKKGCPSTSVQKEQ